jgi:hypothetical protein
MITFHRPEQLASKIHDSEVRATVTMHNGASATHTFKYADQFLIIILLFYTCMISQQMDVYKYVQSHNIVLQQNVFLILVTITGCLIRRIQ